jgi:peroxiredoxin
MKPVFIILLSVFFFFSFKKEKSQTGLNIGDIAPHFTAKNQNGSDVSLKNQLVKGSVVLIFYRGEWCPICNRQLKELEDSLSLITSKGANVIAVTPEKLEYVSKTIEKTKATYNIVSDENLQIMTAYKVNYKLSNSKTKLYKTFGIDLKKSNGTNSNNLPVPAVYIINKDGKIIYKYFDANYKNRASIRDIVNHL